MEWLVRFNAALDYIERNLDSDIDSEEAARIADCPRYHFHRVFSLLAGIPLSEYIRRRRLTSAAFDLQRSQESVLDIALRYGYESHAAFTRAFSELHGIPPQAARKPGAQLKAFPRLSFQVTVSGREELNYRIVQLPAFRVLGKRHTVDADEAFSVIPRIWGQAGSDGTAESLFSLRETPPPPCPDAILGVMTDGDWGKAGSFTYYVSVPSTQQPPQGFDAVTIPAAEWAVFPSETLDGLIRVWRSLYSEWLPASGYILADLPAIECYYPPGHSPQNELWIPVNRNKE